jgi:translation initiation factor IF-2
MGTDARLQQNAERRRRESGQRDELMALLTTHTGAEATPEVFDKFLADLTVETGALPELGRVVEAVKLANSIEAPKVGNAVRQLFRRSRTRLAGAPGAPAPRPAPAASNGPAAPAAIAPEAVAPAATPEAPASEAPAPAASNGLTVAEAAAPVEAVPAASAEATVAEASAPEASEEAPSATPS